MSKYISLYRYPKHISLGMAFHILSPEVFVQIDFLYWELKVGKL